MTSARDLCLERWVGGGIPIVFAGINLFLTQFGFMAGTGWGLTLSIAFLVLGALAARGWALAVWAVAVWAVAGLYACDTVGVLAEFIRHAGVWRFPIVGLMWRLGVIGVLALCARALGQPESEEQPPEVRTGVQPSFWITAAAAVIGGVFCTHAAAGFFVRARADSAIAALGRDDVAAAEGIRKLSWLGRWHPRLLVALADLDLATGAPERAKDRLERVRQWKGRDTRTAGEWTLVMGTLFERNGELGRAVEKYREVGQYSGMADMAEPRTQRLQARCREQLPALLRELRALADEPPGSKTHGFERKVGEVQQKMAIGWEGKIGAFQPLIFPFYGDWSRPLRMLDEEKRRLDRLREERPRAPESTDGGARSESARQNYERGLKIFEERLSKQETFVAGLEAQVAEIEAKRALLRTGLDQLIAELGGK